MSQPSSSPSLIYANLLKVGPPQGACSSRAVKMPSISRSAIRVLADVSGSPGGGVRLCGSAGAFVEVPAPIAESARVQLSTAGCWIRGPRTRSREGWIWVRRPRRREPSTSPRSPRSPNPSHAPTTTANAARETPCRRPHRTRPTPPRRPLRHAPRRHLLPTTHTPYGVTKSIEAPTRWISCHNSSGYRRSTIPTMTVSLRAGASLLVALPGGCLVLSSPGGRAQCVVSGRAVRPGAGPESVQESLDLRHEPLRGGQGGEECLRQTHILRKPNRTTSKHHHLSVRWPAHLPARRIADQPYGVTTSPS